MYSHKKSLSIEVSILDVTGADSKLQMVDRLDVVSLCMRVLKQNYTISAELMYNQYVQLEEGDEMIHKKPLNTLFGKFNPKLNGFQFLFQHMTGHYNSIKCEKY